MEQNAAASQGFYSSCFSGTTATTATTEKEGKKEGKKEKKRETIQKHLSPSQTQLPQIILLCFPQFITKQCFQTLQGISIPPPLPRQEAQYNINLL